MIELCTKMGQLKELPIIAGTGKGGESIWGGKFEDEFHETLKVGEFF